MWPIGGADLRSPSARQQPKLQGAYRHRAVYRTVCLFTIQFTFYFTYLRKLVPNYSVYTEAYLCQELIAQVLLVSATAGISIDGMLLDFKKSSS